MVASSASFSSPARKVGLPLNTRTSPFDVDVSLGVSRYADTFRPWLVQVVPVRVESVRSLGEWGADGLIGGLVEPKIADEVVRLGVPAVNVYGDREVEGISNVCCDDLMVGQLAAEHLGRLNRATYGFYGLCNSRWAKLRRDGYARGLTQHGLAAKLAICEDAIAEMTLNSFWADPAPLARWLRSLARPVAVFCANDSGAYAVHRAALHAGIDLPGDLYLLGVDNSPAFSQAASPPFSSIAQGPIGMRAARCLDLLMQGRPAPHRVAVPPHSVVERGKRDAGPVYPPEVRAALAFIAAHPGEAIQVADVCDHVPLSRRALEIRFKRATGRTLHEQIQLQRMERARMLLTTTRWPIERVAAASGFNDPSRFSHAFTRHEGMSPRRYRQSHVTTTDDDTPA